MTFIAVAMWAFLLQLASRVGLLEAYESASAVLLAALVAVLAAFAHRRPPLRLHLDEPERAAAAATPEPGPARRVPRRARRATHSPALR